MSVMGGKFDTAAIDGSVAGPAGRAGEGPAVATGALAAGEGEEELPPRGLLVGPAAAGLGTMAT